MRKISLDIKDDFEKLDNDYFGQDIYINKTFKYKIIVFYEKNKNYGDVYLFDGNLGREKAIVNSTTYIGPFSAKKDHKSNQIYRVNIEVKNEYIDYAPTEEFIEFKKLFTNNESDQFILDEHKRLKENMRSVPEIDCVVSYKKMLDNYKG